MPIVIAYHLIWTVYGWWLPNDLRGSTSKTIGSDVIAALGELHFGRNKIQPAGRHVRAFYEHAAKILRHPLLEIRDRAVEIVAAAFARVITEQKYTCYACAIMPDHVHILIRKHKHSAEEMIELLQNAARWALIDGQLRPDDHPGWTAGGGWKVFLMRWSAPFRISKIIRRRLGCRGSVGRLWWRMIGGRCMRDIVQTRHL